MIQIRPYTSDDVESLADLMSDLGYPTTVDKMKLRMRHIAEESNYYTYVAAIDEKVVGMIGIRSTFYYEEDGTATRISVLVTKKQYEGQGIGTVAGARVL